MMVLGDDCRVEDLGDGHEEDLDMGLCDDPDGGHGEAEGLGKVPCRDPGTDPCGDSSGDRGDLGRDRNRV